MDKKLTLSLNATVVYSAKLYAKEKGTSLSRMVENYLSLVVEVNGNKKEDDISPLVARLVGVVEIGPDDEADYVDYLTDKYK